MQHPNVISAGLVALTLVSSLMANAWGLESLKVYIVTVGVTALAAVWLRQFVRALRILSFANEVMGYALKFLTETATAAKRAFERLSRRTEKSFEKLIQYLADEPK